MVSPLSRIFCRRRNVVGSKRRQRRRKLRRKRVDAMQMKIKAFIEWSSEVGIKLHPNILITKQASYNGLGVIAAESIAEGECVAVIPRSAVLSSETCPLKELITKQEEVIKGWVPLLLSLSAEYSKGCNSRWWPYLALVPNPSSPLPMLWLKEERYAFLEATGLLSSLKRDDTHIEKDYQSLFMSFVEQHLSHFREHYCSQDFYRELVAFVMSYSFTDNEAGGMGRTMMVPFVDILNHSSYHHVELNFDPEALKLIAVRKIEKGEEVMNTYGDLPNASLLHMYGFAEVQNPHDEAIISRDTIRQCILQRCNDIHTRRWATITKLGALEDDYYVSMSGEVDPHLLLFIRILCSCKQVKKLLDSQPPTLEECSTEELDFLKHLLQYCLKKYPLQITEPPLPPNALKESPLPPDALKEFYSQLVILGQQNALRNATALLN